jgi:general secretion pathway protein E
MIGEIRDLETAQIAVQSSLTGHLVFSTLHTNTATGAITRLRDMGIEPYLISSTLLAVLSQRLVRVLCPDCREAYTLSSSEYEELDLPADNPPTVYRPVGCPNCNHLGYIGRIGIHELVELNDDLRSGIHNGLSEHELEAIARKDSKSIRQDGLQKALEGVTSLEEVFRVTKED